MTDGVTYEFAYTLPIKLHFAGSLAFTLPQRALDLLSSPRPHEVSLVPQKLLTLLLLGRAILQLKCGTQMADVIKVNFKLAWKVPVYVRAGDGFREKVSGPDAALGVP